MGYSKSNVRAFCVDKSGTSRYLKNIFNTGELDVDEKVVVAKIATSFSTVQSKKKHRLWRLSIITLMCLYRLDIGQIPQKPFNSE